MRRKFSTTHKTDWIWIFYIFSTVFLRVSNFQMRKNFSETFILRVLHGKEYFEEFSIFHDIQHFHITTSNNPRKTWWENLCLFCTGIWERQKLHSEKWKKMRWKLKIWIFPFFWFIIISYSLFILNRNSSHELAWEIKICWIKKFGKKDKIWKIEFSWEISQTPENLITLNLLNTRFESSNHRGKNDFHRFPEISLIFFLNFLKSFYFPVFITRKGALKNKFTSSLEWKIILLVVVAIVRTWILLIWISEYLHRCCFLFPHPKYLP